MFEAVRLTKLDEVTAILDSLPTGGDAEEARGAIVNGRDEDGRTPLFMIASRGSAVYSSSGGGFLKDANDPQKILCALIAAGADVNIADKSGDTPLHRAAAAGCAPMVDELIAAGAGASVGVKGEYGRFPIHWAVAKGYGAEAVPSLIQHDSDWLSRTDENGLTAFLVATNNVNITAMEVMIEHVAKKCEEEEGCQQQLQKLLGASVDDKYGRNALHILAGQFFGKAEPIAALAAALEKHFGSSNCNKNTRPFLDMCMARDAKGNTPLATIRFQGDKSAAIIHALLNGIRSEAALKGATDDTDHINTVIASFVNAANPSGFTALHYAASTGTAEVVQLLLDAGATVPTRNSLTTLDDTPTEEEAVVKLEGEEERTPLHRAVHENEEHAEAIIATLIAAGHAVCIGRRQKEKGEGGRVIGVNTPLHAAMFAGNLGGVKALLASGKITKELLFIKNTSGATALHELPFGQGAQNSVAILAALAEHLVAADAKAVGGEGGEEEGDSSSLPPSSDTLTELLNAKDAMGNTILHLACNCRDKPLITALVSGQLNNNTNGAASEGEDSQQIASIAMDVNAKTNNGWSPFYLATAYRRAEIITALLEADAERGAIDVNAADSNSGNTPLHSAVIGKEPSTIRALLAIARKQKQQQKDAPNEDEVTPPEASPPSTEEQKDESAAAAETTAPADSAEKEAHVLVEESPSTPASHREVDVNAVSSRRGWTPLHHACDAQYLEGIQLILEAKRAEGADVNVSAISNDNDGANTPLHTVISAAISKSGSGAARAKASDADAQNTIAIVTSLIEASADVNVKNAANLTPLGLITQVLHKANKTAEGSDVSKTATTEGDSSPQLFLVALREQLLNAGAEDIPIPVPTSTAPSNSTPTASRKSVSSSSRSQPQPPSPMLKAAVTVAVFCIIYKLLF